MLIACHTRVVVSLVLGLCASAWLATTAHAEPSLTGAWRAGKTTMAVKVESWGKDCGPEPRSSESQGGGLVNISQEGHVVIIHGQQPIRTDKCWSPNPALKRVSSSFVDGLWSVHCKTGPNDPREEEGDYALKSMGADQLVYQDVSRYNWMLNESRCKATITTVQSLTRANPTVAASNKPVASTPASTSAPVPKAPEVACKPGAAARLEVRPSHAQLELGGQLCLRAQAVDAAGCRVPDAPVSWSLKHSKALKATLNDNCFRAGESAAESEGEFQVIATSGALHAEATLDVRSADLSALIAKRIETGAVNGFDAQPAALPVVAPVQAARAKVAATQPSSQAAAVAPWLLIALGVLGLAVIGWVAVRMRKPLKVRSKHITGDFEPFDDAPDAPAPNEPAPVAAAPSPQPVPAVTSSESWICPTCRRGFPASQQRCPNDGAALMPYREFTQAHRTQVEGARSKRCPKCGETFQTNSGFCGKDGSPLIDA
jgi:hypothetical protein